MRHNEVGLQMMAFHINLLPYLNTLTADHTGYEGTVMITEGSELRHNTNQWVNTTYLPNICDNLSYMPYTLTNNTGTVVPLKSCYLPNYTWPQAQDHNFTQKKYLL
jgi:hypothetical protein